jgi:RNA polymerase sigma-70 factor (ECF subfamily)
MDVAGELTRHRRHLTLVAYRMLGSLQAAEDVVQEAYLRAERAGPEAIVEPRAWLTRVVTRLALDELKSARTQREAYVGPWLPEPLLADDLHDPADQAVTDDQFSLALLTVLETLSPAERAVYVLHEAFGVPLDEVASIVGRTPAATRQLAVRARRHVQEESPRFDTDPEEQRRLVLAFKVATETGDLDALARLLDENVVFRADGGGVVRAVQRPITGRTQVTKLLASGLRNVDDLVVRTAIVNGEPGLIARANGIASVLAFVVEDGKITHIDVIANPEKLARLRSSALEAIDTGE